MKKPEPKSGLDFRLFFGGRFLSQFEAQRKELWAGASEWERKGEEGKGRRVGKHSARSARIAPVMPERMSQCQLHLLVEKSKDFAIARSVLRVFFFFALSKQSEALRALCVEKYLFARRLLVFNFYHPF